MSAGRRRETRGPRQPRAEGCAGEAAQLYPPIKPYNSGFLRVSDVHEIYFEECGNPKGKPAVFLHGGPGGGTDAEDAALLRSEALSHRAVRSARLRQEQPHASLEQNTTWDLVADTEKLREHLGIDKWLVFGGSWGSTLALAYAETHPERVTELVLRGIFLLRRSELEWFYQNPQGAAIALSRTVGELRRGDSGSGARRHDGRVLPAARPAPTPKC